MVGEWTAIGRNLENWMSCLPEEICHSVPIIHLAIPGSHVSASYTIDMGSTVSPDCQTLVTTVGALIKPLLLNWAVTQKSSIAEQLRAGVRYLDLRVASCPKGKQIHVVHGLYGGQIYDILIEVDMFLRSHKHEIVIVDFQRFYKFSPTNHTQLRETVKGIFGNKLCPLPKCLFNLTLSSMREQGYQAVVIYREENAMPEDDTELLWPSRSWLVYRPSSENASTMLRELERDIARRPSGAQGYISVCAITPDSTFMQKNVMSNHSDACVKPCQSVIIPWIDIHRSGHAGFNVLVTDFVDSIPFCSHNSGSYTITRSSALGSDAFGGLRRWNACCGPYLRRIVYNWVVNQTATITEQLKEGVRYLDFRLGSKPGTDRIHIVHGLFGDAIDGFLSEVKSFLDTHSEEIVIIDFQHCYEMNAVDHAVVEGLLFDLFDKRMCPWIPDMSRITINYMLEKGYQLIVVYRDWGEKDELWSGDYFFQAWPNTPRITTMFNYLENELRNRTTNSAHITQCILTPDGSFIFLHLCSSLESSMAAPCNRAIIPWLKNQTPGYSGPNIVMSEFIKMHGIPFCETVIRLNYKYLDED